MLGVAMMATLNRAVKEGSAEAVSASLLPT